MHQKKIIWYNRIGWFLFVIAMLNLLGVFTHYKTDEEAALELVGAFLPSIDVKTIALAGLALFCGYSSRKLGQADGVACPRGGKLIVAAIICLALTFSQLPTYITILKTVSYSSQPVYECQEISEQNYIVNALLGPEDSSHADILKYPIDFSKGYIGVADTAYKKCRVCGSIKVFLDEPSIGELIITLGLLDENGNDILTKDGQPYAITCEKDYRVYGDELECAIIETFDTDVINVRKLAAQPYSFRVLSVQTKVLVQGIAF